MAEHRIRKNNIIYIIPNDELFEKWNNDEAFIDDYGRLMNRRPNRVLKELKHYVDDSQMVQQRVPLPTRTSPPVTNYLKGAVRDRLIDTSEMIIDRAVDKFFYEVLPNVWHEHIVPFYRQMRDALTVKELRANAVLTQAKTYAAATTKPTISMRATQTEVDVEKRKVLYHWIGMLSCLKKLHDLGEVDIGSILTQLTDPAMLNQVNCFLMENPNLLETDKYIMLHSLLGRDLYKENQLMPIEATEIVTIAASYGYSARPEKMENNYNG